MNKLTPLSASRIKTAQSCSWKFWATYHLKVPDQGNDGSSRGTICHLLFELLGNPKHNKKYNKILLSESIYDCEPVRRLVMYHAKRLSVDDSDNLSLISDMTMAGLNFDFFGERGGDISEIILEKDFDITVDEEDKLYRLRGFIDVLFLYEKEKKIIIRDFKTSKSVFKGKDITDNLQDLIYTLAVKKLFPHFTKRQMEFLFLKYDLNSTGRVKMKSLSSEELEGLEYQLTQIQSFIDNFTEETAISNFAAQQSFPSDGTFGGPLMCGKEGYKILKGSPLLDKDGNKVKAYICSHRNPLRYWVIEDSNGKIIKSAFEDKKDSLRPDESKGEKLVLKRYEGCPYWQQKASADDFFKEYS